MISKSLKALAVTVHNRPHAFKGLLNLNVS